MTKEIQSPKCRNALSRAIAGLVIRISSFVIRFSELQSVQFKRPVSGPPGLPALIQESREWSADVLIREFLNFAKSPRGQGSPRSFLNQPWQPADLESVR